MHLVVLAWQARILLAVGLGALALGLYSGVDPLTATWRATAAAWLATWLSGWFLRLMAEVVASGLAQAAEVEAVPATASPPRRPGPAR